MRSHRSIRDRGGSLDRRYRFGEARRHAENFDVIVMPNLYGDVLSDVAAQIAGSVGLAGSSNIGEKVAMFEAIHGSAPRRAGQNMANPSGLFLGSILMLVHINQPDVAAAAHNAWLRRSKTACTPTTCTRKASRREGRNARICRSRRRTSRQKPQTLKPVEYSANVVDENPKPIFSTPVRRRRISSVSMCSSIGGKEVSTGRERARRIGRESER
jgi:hypothetical protein